MYQHNSTLKARQKSMPPAQKPLARSGKLPARSAKMKAAVAAGPVNPEGPVRCLACRGTSGLSRSHILTRSQFPQHAFNPGNLVWLCIWPCHEKWENHKQQFRADHPLAWNEKLAAMRKLNRSYYAFFCQKNGGPV